MQNEKLMEEIRDAVARGWYHEKNEHKFMDVDLVDAISEEIYKLVEKYAQMHPAVMRVLEGKPIVFQDLDSDG